MDMPVFSMPIRDGTVCGRKRLSICALRFGPMYPTNVSMLRPCPSRLARLFSSVEVFYEYNVYIRQVLEHVCGHSIKEVSQRNNKHSIPSHRLLRLNQFESSPAVPWHFCILSRNTPSLEERNLPQRSQLKT